MTFNGLRWTNMINNKTLAVVAIIGFIACLASFIIALINSKYIVSIMFLFSAIYCINHFSLSLKSNK